MFPCYFFSSFYVRFFRLNHEKRDFKRLFWYVNLILNRDSHLDKNCFESRFGLRTNCLKYGLDSFSTLLRYFSIRFEFTQISSKQSIFSCYQKRFKPKTFMITLRRIACQWYLYKKYQNRLGIRNFLNFSILVLTLCNPLEFKF